MKSRLYSLLALPLLLLTACDDGEKLDADAARAAYDSMSLTYGENVNAYKFTVVTKTPSVSAGGTYQMDLTNHSFKSEISGDVEIDAISGKAVISTVCVPASYCYMLTKVGEISLKTKFDYDLGSIGSETGGTVIEYDSMISAMLDGYLENFEGVDVSGIKKGEETTLSFVKGEDLLLKLTLKDNFPVKVQLTANKSGEKMDYTLSFSSIESFTTSAPADADQYLG